MEGCFQNFSCALIQGFTAERRAPHGGKPTSGPLYLLRNDAGELFGVYGRNAQSALSAAPLELKLRVDNPFRGLDFFETDEGGLMVRG